MSEKKLTFCMTGTSDFSTVMNDEAAQKIIGSFSANPSSGVIVMLGDPTFILNRRNIAAIRVEAPLRKSEPDASRGA